MVNDDHCNLTGQKFIHSELPKLYATKLNSLYLCCVFLRSRNEGSLTFLLCELNDEESWI
jgi:hypothetical protein